MSKEGSPHPNAEPRGDTPEGQGPRANASQDNPADDNKVGPGRPPRHTRWPKGGPSPNPKGRPRKAQSMLPDVRKLLEQAMNKKVRVSRGDKKVLMTKLELSFEQQLNQAAKGDRHALRLLMDIAPKVGVDFQAKHKQILEEALAPNYQAILDDALARLSGANTSTPAVLAPPELLDDDRAETAPPAPSRPKATAAGARAPAPANTPATATPAAPLAKTKFAATPRSLPATKTEPAATLTAAAAPPKAAASLATPPPENKEHALMPVASPWAQIERATTPPPRSEAKSAAALEPTTSVKETSAPRLEPPLKPGVHYPKPFRQMTPMAKKIYFPEWCAEHPELCEERADFSEDKR